MFSTVWETGAYLRPFFNNTFYTIIQLVVINSIHVNLNTFGRRFWVSVLMFCGTIAQMKTVHITVDETPVESPPPPPSPNFLFRLTAFNTLATCPGFFPSAWSTPEFSPRGLVLHILLSCVLASGMFMKMSIVVLRALFCGLAQLVERRTSHSMTRVRMPSWAQEYFRVKNVVLTLCRCT